MEKSFKFASYFVGFLIVAFLVQFITSSKLTTLKKSSYDSTTVITLKEREKQLDCLAINIYREAGNEDFEGKVAVAQVTMNRVSHPDFPKDVCAVVYQKNVYMEKVVCQFSWHCDSKAYNRPVNQVAYKESYAVAKKVLLEGFELDLLKDALYYHAHYVSPNWKLDRIGTVGSHIFYKSRNKK